MTLSTLVRRQLLKVVRAQFELDQQGVHGPSHWARVRQNGLKLAKETGARTSVVELFALIHDSRRENDFEDPEHGRRAARFAEELAGDVFKIAESDLRLLVLACEGHSDGATEADITVATCWDADRLDLGRVGIKPRPDRLCTEAARNPEMIAWAYRRSGQQFS